MGIFILGVVITFTTLFNHWLMMRGVEVMDSSEALLLKEEYDVAKDYELVVGEDGDEVEYEDIDGKKVERKKKKVDKFDENFIEGEEVARLLIPSIKMSYDVFKGTSVGTLAKGVGMYESEWTTTPRGLGHTVLSGHRDSVFRPVKDIIEGDLLILEYGNKKYFYEVEKIWITDKDDLSVIVEKDEATLTLTTCYPFYFVGDAPDRYIIESKLKRVIE